MNRREFLLVAMYAVGCGKKVVRKPEEEWVEIDDPFANYEDTSYKGNKLLDIERAVLKYTNIERRRHGLKELKWDDKLSEIAREHSQDMAKNDYLNHVNQKGETPNDRAKRKGFPLEKRIGKMIYKGVTENIGTMAVGPIRGLGFVHDNADSIAKARVQSWMNSPAHRENILTPHVEVIGIGVGYNEKTRKYYVTQNSQ